MKQLVVVKLGGSVITKKSENKLEIDCKNLRRLCREISEAKKKLKCNLIIVHGAGPFGHMFAEKYRLTGGFKGERTARGVCETHASMERLNAAVVGELNKAGVNAIALQPSAGGILENRRLISFQLEVVEGMLGLGLTPVGYGDVLLDVKTGVNILSGDHLVPYLASELSASRIVIATDVSGIYDSDPRRNKKARLVREITRGNVDEMDISGSRGVDVTGGMKRKVMELLDVAEHGITSQVVSGLKTGELKKALLGDRKLGTIIR